MVNPADLPCTHKDTGIWYGSVIKHEVIRIHCNNRIKEFLDYKGITVPFEYQNTNWSHNFINRLNGLQFEHKSNCVTLSYLLSEMKLLLVKKVYVLNRLFNILTL